MTDAYRTALTIDDVEVGDTAPELVVDDVNREDFVRYAGASGDFNRIHYDEPYATAAGNPSVFGQGMLVAGYAAHLAADWFGLANIESFSVRFESRVWPDETLAVTGEVTDIRRSDAGGTVVADISVATTDDEVVVSGVVEATLPGGDE